MDRQVDSPATGHQPRGMCNLYRVTKTTAEVANTFRAAHGGAGHVGENVYPPLARPRQGNVGRLRLIMRAQPPRFMIEKLADLLALVDEASKPAPRPRTELHLTDMRGRIADTGRRGHFCCNRRPGVRAMPMRGARRTCLTNAAMPTRGCMRQSSLGGPRLSKRKELEAGRQAQREAGVLATTGKRAVRGFAGWERALGRNGVSCDLRWWSYLATAF